MASESITVQHTCKGLLKFILHDDSEIDLEVMTLTGVQVYRKDRNCVEKGSSLGASKIHLPHSFKGKLGRPKAREQKNF